VDELRRREKMFNIKSLVIILELEHVSKSHTEAIFASRFYNKDTEVQA